jgi:hypothetical protein
MMKVSLSIEGKMSKEFLAQAIAVSDAYHDLVIHLWQSQDDKAKVRKWKKLKMSARRQLREDARKYKATKAK